MEYEAVHIRITARVQSVNEKFEGDYYEDNIDPLLESIREALEALSNDSYEVTVEPMRVDPL